MARNSVMPFPPTTVFILGCQRSGTTWLANIFDASADTLLFMEPFSPPYGIFPEFPAASQFLDGSTPALDRLLQGEMPARLMHYKSWWSPRSIVDPAVFRREMVWSQRVKRFAPPPLRRRIRKFELLNLNRFDADAPIHAKSATPMLAAIKELRFAGKVPLLRQALPDAHMIVIIRHPMATVQSILGWFKKRRLVELREELITYLDVLHAQPVSEPYRGLIAKCRSEGLAHTVALYWRISYETMLARIEGAARARVLVYEQLARSPRETAMGLFAGLGVPWSPTLDAYVSHSTSAEAESTSPIDTRRDSSTYYRSWVGRVPAEIARAVDEITGDSPLMSLFDPYYRGGAL